MVINGQWRGKSLTLSFKPNSITISLQDAADSRVCSFDGEGRLWTAMLRGIAYRRGLNGKTVAKWQIANGERERRWLDAVETDALQEEARVLIQELLADLGTGSAKIPSALCEEDLDGLRRAADFDSMRYRDDVQAYHRVYLPVGILPPDQYMAVVLQATEGCSFNTCTFCTFYRDRKFRIQTPESFRAHALAVKAYLGRGLALRRTLFLGDANSLVIPMPRLLRLMDVVHQVFDVEALGGMYAFLDGFSGEKKTAADFAALAQAGLKRVYVGMESGSPALLKLLKKPGDPAHVIEAVHAMKAGGVAVGVIVMLGAGGTTYAEEHVRETIRALNAMPLDADDLIYFSELVESEGMEYTQNAYRQQLTPLDAPARIAQGEAIERALRFDEQRGVPHISRYDIREFVY